MVSRYSLMRHCEERLLRRSNLTVLMIILLIGCTPASPVTPTTVPASETPAPTLTPTSLPDYVTRIRNAEYQLAVTDALRVVQLSNGQYEQGSPDGTDYVSVTVTDFVASGDLNGDGRDEVAVLVAENYGGSGVFMFLAVYASLGGDLRFQTSIIVDDRPLINALSIEEGEIFLDATIHGAEDPFCCPTLKTTQRYELGATGQLELVEFSSFTPDDRPRIITIESPAAGTEVSSSFSIRGRVSIAPFENNLVYRIYSTGDVELAVGSITVSAEELGGPGTFDEIISLGTILTGTTIRIELQDLSAADGSLLAMDSVELVVK